MLPLSSDNRVHMEDALLLGLYIELCQLKRVTSCYCWSIDQPDVMPLQPESYCSLLSTTAPSNQTHKHACNLTSELPQLPHEAAETCGWFSAERWMEKKKCSCENIKFSTVTLETWSCCLANAVSQLGLTKIGNTCDYKKKKEKKKVMMMSHLIAFGTWGCEEALLI